MWLPRCIGCGMNDPTNDRCLLESANEESKQLTQRSLMNERKLNSSSNPSYHVTIRSMPCRWEDEDLYMLSSWVEGWLRSGQPMRPAWPGQYVPHSTPLKTPDIHQKTFGDQIGKDSTYPAACAQNDTASQQRNTQQLWDACQKDWLQWST